MADTKLQDRIYGCMIGGAVGDAMGFPQEAFHYKAIRRRWGRIDSPRVRENCDGWDPPVNGPVYTDDTVMKHMVCDAIFLSEGRPTIENIAKVWKNTIKDLDQWVWWNNTKVVAAKLKWNPTIPLEEIGRDSVPCDDAAMIVGPIGIINAGDPEKAASEAFELSAIWQNGYSRECAAAMAACHAEALKDDATVDSIIETARKYSPTMKPYIDKAIKVVSESSDADDFTEKFYETLDFPNQAYWDQLVHGSPDISFGADPLEVCTEALAFLALSEGDARTAILGGANFGRDCDTIAGIAGAFCGALNGSENIPAEWVKAIVEANPTPDIREYSQKLYEKLLSYQET